MTEADGVYKDIYMTLLKLRLKDNIPALPNLSTRGRRHDANWEISNYTGAFQTILNLGLSAQILKQHMRKLETRDIECYAGKRIYPRKQAGLSINNI